MTDEQIYIAKLRQLSIQVGEEGLREAKAKADAAECKLEYERLVLIATRDAMPVVIRGQSS